MACEAPERQKPPIHSLTKAVSPGTSALQEKTASSRSPILGNIAKCSTPYRTGSSSVRSAQSQGKEPGVGPYSPNFLKLKREAGLADTFANTSKRLNRGSNERSSEQLPFVTPRDEFAGIGSARKIATGSKRIPSEEFSSIQSRKPSQDAASTLRNYDALARMIDERKKSLNSIKSRLVTEQPSSLAGLSQIAGDTLKGLGQDSRSFSAKSDESGQPLLAEASTRIGPIDVRSRVHEKDLEILELKNAKMKLEMELQQMGVTLRERAAEIRSKEDALGRLNGDLERKDLELEHLRKVRVRLEADLADLSRLSSEQERMKIRHVEKLLEDKTREVYELKARLTEMEAGHADRLLKVEERHAEMLRELEQRLKDGDSRAKELAEAEERNRKMEDDYRTIISKIVELEEMQNSLIAENANLRGQLNSFEDTARNNTSRIREVGSSLFLVYDRLQNLEVLTTKLLRIIETLLNGEEPSLELLIGKKKVSKVKYPSRLEAMLDRNDEASLKAFGQETIALIDEIVKAINSGFNLVCDKYAARYSLNQ
eukprot:TRINITY_DN2816_c0_g2_i5.p1 TRINITY_DN2816_c0_g2~~TRINITY_DN2816_c0_g2_i5.p1  ORF type:complete len:542 (-),score=120.67 TRINITY_DN2816_c0_g2_i5:112-1737(-)